MKLHRYDLHHFIVAETLADGREFLRLYYLPPSRNSGALLAMQNEYAEFTATEYGLDMHEGAVASFVGVGYDDLRELISANIVKTAS